jgi:hypothetical protein
MKPAFLFFVVLLPLSMPAAFGGVPELSVKAVCKAMSANAETWLATPDQSRADCLREEKAAKQKVVTLWESTSVSIRNRCESSPTSYLGLLVCLQIAEDLKSGPKKETGKQ